jgi:polyhydroxyalkanoate synthesis regulator phasin
MSDKPNDFIDQYQAWVREGLQTWSRQFDPKAASPGAGSSEAVPGDIMGRLFAGLAGYGDWMRSMASGESPAAPFGAGMPPCGQGGVGMPPFMQGGVGMPPYGQGGAEFLSMGMPPFGYGPPPGATAQPGSESFDEWARVANETLSMPAFGLNREQQEEQQALLRAWIDYAGHYQRYQTLLQGVYERAGETLRGQTPPGDAESMRSVYDRWVTLVEESYAQAALSAEFREVYASLVNAQMRLKVLQQSQLERVSVQAGMPTRKEVDSLGERLQAVRRELRQMHGLAAEVEALKAEVAALRAGTGKPKPAKAAPAAAVKKAAAKSVKRPPRGKSP